MVIRKISIRSSELSVLTSKWNSNEDKAWRDTASGQYTDREKFCLAYCPVKQDGSKSACTKAGNRLDREKKIVSRVFCFGEMEPFADLG